MPNKFLSPEGDLENYLITESWLIDQWVGDTLWGWRDNDKAQLGNNATNGGTTPVTTFAGGANWKQVSCGTDHTAAVKIDGTLWTWGSNQFGHLGINSGNTSSTPVTTFAGGTDWKQVSCGHYHTAAIKTDGTLWTWGRNDNGQMGINIVVTAFESPRCTPITTFAGGTNWKQVSCGGLHTAAIKTDGTLWVWGGNSSGQLGINFSNLINKSTPVTTFAGGTNWKQVSGGSFYTAAIKTDGTLWTWGNNSNASLGDNTIINRSTPVTTFAGGTNWKQVSGGFYPTAAVKTDGTLWTWGSNQFAQLGVNDRSIVCTPITTFTGGTNWKQVVTTITSRAAIKTDGTLWVWGYGNSVGAGGLGNNDTTNKSTPVTTFLGGTNWKQVECGEGHVMAVTSGTDPTIFIS